MINTKTAALVAEVERLTKELAEAKQDAERYQYILIGAPNSDILLCECDGYEYFSLDKSEDEIEAIIDEGMRRTAAGATAG